MALLTLAAHTTLAAAGVHSFGDFSLHKRRKVTQGAGAGPPAISYSSSAKPIP
jgi:hypothetical protein